MSDLISVIVPVYNVEKYLKKCLDSILDQSYSNLEIILVDDGSNDQSGRICDVYEKKDSRIKVIHKPNEGLGLARNTGLNYIHGKYVTFVDSDDWIDDDLVQNLYDGISVNKCDTSIGGYERINHEGNVAYTERYRSAVYNENIYGTFFIKMLGSLPAKHDSIRMSVWNTLYNTDIIKDHNIYFASERELISEDLPFNEKYYHYSKRVAVLDSVSYKYRISEGSLTRSYKSERFELTCKLYTYMEKCISKLGTEGTVRLQKQFFVNLRMCIAQESKQISHKTPKESLNSINKICSAQVVRRVVNEYPHQLLNIRQKIFFMMIKKKAVKLLYLAAQHRAL